MDAPESFRGRSEDIVLSPSEETDEFKAGTALKSGFKSVHRATIATHPLEESLLHHDRKVLNMRLNMLRSTQGMFSPIQTRMELSTAEKGARRLPCLPSSHLSREILLADDITISPKEIFNDPSQAEVMGEPHIMTEVQAGLKVL